MANALYGNLHSGICVLVAINYKRFLPAGTATLTFTRPEFVPAALKVLHRTVFSGKTLRAQILSPNALNPRRRGQKGLNEAAERGIITGDGPGAGLTGGAKNVVIYGLPPTLRSHQVTDNLRDFKLAGSEQGRPVVIKAEWAERRVADHFLMSSF